MEIQFIYIKTSTKLLKFTDIQPRRQTKSSSNTQKILRKIRAKSHKNLARQLCSDQKFASSLTWNALLYNPRLREKSQVLQSHSCHTRRLYIYIPVNPCASWLLFLLRIKPERERERGLASKYTRTRSFCEFSTRFLF